MIWGTQLSFAAGVLRETTGVFAGKRGSPITKRLVALLMQVVVSVSVLAGAAFLLRRPGTPEQEKAIWAAVGVVIGYWLR